MRKNDFGWDAMPELLLRLAIPTMLAQLINALYSIVDRMFIGHIADNGGLFWRESGCAAPLFHCSPPSLSWSAIVQSYMLLITMPLGCQCVVSFNLGAGSGKRVKQAADLFDL